MVYLCGLIKKNEPQDSVLHFYPNFEHVYRPQNFSAYNKKSRATQKKYGRPRLSPWVARWATQDFSFCAALSLCRHDFMITPFYNHQHTRYLYHYAAIAVIVFVKCKLLLMTWLGHCNRRLTYGNEVNVQYYYWHGNMIIYHSSNVTTRGVAVTILNIGMVTSSYIIVLMMTWYVTTTHVVEITIMKMKMMMMTAMNAICIFVNQQIIQ